MTTIKTNQQISCSNIQDARVKADKITNGVIVVKNDNYLIVNYKTFLELQKTGFTQAR